MNVISEMLIYHLSILFSFSSAHLFWFASFTSFQRGLIRSVFCWAIQFCLHCVVIHAACLYSGSSPNFDLIWHAHFRMHRMNSYLRVPFEIIRLIAHKHTQTYIHMNTVGKYNVSRLNVRNYHIYVDEWSEKKVNFVTRKTNPTNDVFHFDLSLEGDNIASITQETERRKKKFPIFFLHYYQLWVIRSDRFSREQLHK